MKIVELREKRQAVATQATIPYLGTMNEHRHAIEDIFSATGALSVHPDYEHRPQQGKMAMAIADALEQRRHLIVEAPTGVGKTLAYLVPVILFALREHRKAIISTHTKNLQEQLIQKDIPLVRSAIPADFKAVTMKGRKNYLCKTRLHNALGSTRPLFDDQGQEELRKIYEWSSNTEDGDIEGLGFAPQPEVWEMVCSEQGICSAATCGQGCFFQRVKEQARAAHLVIMNHALFFTLMGLQGTEDRFIFDNDFVVFDEAHTLEGVAAAGVGKRLSRRQVLIALHRLYNPKTSRGLLGRQKKSLKTLCAETEAAVDGFFAEVRQAAISLRKNNVDGHGSQAREIRIRSPRFVPNTLSNPLSQLEKEIRKLEEGTENSLEKQELAAARRSLWEAQVVSDEFLEQTDLDLTYWVELAGERSGNVTLCASPSDVSTILGARLFREETSVIMTSATLSVAGDLDYFQKRIGAQHVTTAILDSPFDHARQMRLRIARDIPEPEDPAFAESLPRWIMESIDRSGGKALVLFTSTSLMKTMALNLREEFSRRGIQLLVQGEEMQRHTLLEAFKRDIHSVLFGLDSFWMGVDVPGEALEHVVITRLPFAVPNHPLIEARLESIMRRGGNSFLEYTLPEAVLKFRQGAGRLIRSKTDTGIVSILDSRILRKRYGSVFISSIPRCPVEILTSSGEAEFHPVEE